MISLGYNLSAPFTMHPELKDTVTIVPHNFEPKIPRITSISNSLNKKFANKVVNNVGLCIALWDIIKVEEAYIFPGDGSSHSVVRFRFIVFRPFMDEILIGKVKSCSREGVQVTVNFFDDIFIPADSLQEPSRFDESEQLWVWSYADEGGATPHDLFMDLGEEIRFRVTEETFTDTSPSGPEGVGTDGEDNSAEKLCPYRLTGCISEPGLGLLTWWSAGAEPNDQADG